MSLNIVFMGTPEFSLPSLQALIKKNFNVLCVYTQPPAKSKRGQKIEATPIEKFAKENKINIKNPINLNSQKELEEFHKLSADIVVVVAYGQIIPKIFLDKARFGFINLHASLLPKWRGAAPIQRAIMNEDKSVGVSIMKIEEQLDTGPVLFSKEIKLDRETTHGEIEKELSTMGADLIIESLKIIESGSAKFLKQEHSKATYAKKIKKNETKINWNLSADKVLAHVHGLSPNPGAWFEYESERFKVIRAKKSLANGKPGIHLDDNLTIACKSDSIQILEIQRQGKKKQTTKDFILGKKINKGTSLS